MHSTSKLATDAVYPTTKITTSPVTPVAQTEEANVPTK